MPNFLNIQPPIYLVWGDLMIDEPPLPPPLGVENVKILKESGVRRDPLQPF